MRGRVGPHPKDQDRECPSICREFPGLIDGETFKGQGTEHSGSLAGKPKNPLILDYTPDQRLITDIYRKCSGTVTFNELFCNGCSLSFEVRGGLGISLVAAVVTAVGDLGAFPDADHQFERSGFSGWRRAANEIIPNIVISGDPACRGADIMGVFIHWYLTDLTEGFVVRTDGLQF